MRLFDFLGSKGSLFCCLDAPDWLSWEGDSASKGSEMVRCNGPPGLSSLGSGVLCLNSAKCNVITQMFGFVNRIDNNI